ncbi:MAG: DNA translocase FtsK 4TM domain-containing protein [Patescibacteria group bacterium]|nr:DNA translocase FtsK 4TM domain-containing protein [Patescibacteria group bacterium]
MAKRRRRQAPSNRSKSKKAKNKKNQKGNWEVVEFNMSPETATEITAISFVLLGVLLILSLTGVFGSFGHAVNLFIHQIFGWMAPVFAVSLIVLGIVRFYPDKYKIGMANYLGFAMFNLWLPALVHLFISSDRSYEVALDGAGGGMIGHYIGTSLKDSVSFTGALVLLIAFILISLLVLFNTSFKRLQEKMEMDSLGNPTGSLMPKQLSKLKINMPQASLKDKVTGKLRINGVETKNQESNKAKNQENSELEKPKVIKEEINWNFPTMDLLEDSKYSVDSGNVTGNAEIIANTLSQFGITVAMQDVNVGPTFTQYTLKPAEGTKLSKITTLQDDLALALAVHPIRIEAPIPGKSLVGVEIPNKKVALVRLKEILASGEYRSSVDRGNLVVALGKDVSGTPAMADISKMPHLLVAGATGSGKSVCVNGILASLLFQYSPKELRLIMVDPKRVEMTGYNGIAHLLTPVITDPDKTINAFRWAVIEMENRYKILSAAGARDIAGYNKKLSKDEEKMPYLVLVVDELADVMLTAGQEMEGLIVRIAQMARAVGIHLILATQRPSVNVVTGLIKANIPCRIAFRVASQIDSRTILDAAGAERLIGKGDMLFMAGDGQKPKRIQGVFVDDREINSILDNVKSQQEPQYNEDVVKSHKGPAAGGEGLSGMNGEVDDDMYQQAYDEVVRSGKASASLLQRRLRVGYARAARLLDLLEEQGVIGQADGARPREILVSRDEGGTAGIYDDDWGGEKEI